MRLRYLSVVQVLVVYVPFEDLILLVSNLPPAAYAAARTLPEAVILTLLSALFVQRTTQNRHLYKTGLELPFLLIVGGGFLSLLLNNGSWYPGLMNMRALLRFIFLGFLVAQLDATSAQIRKTMNLIILAAIVQAAFSILQILTPPLDDLLRHMRSSLYINISGIEKISAAQKIGNATGTFSEAVSAGMYFCVAISILSLQRFTRGVAISRRLYWPLILLFLFATFLTYKRSTFILALGCTTLIPVAFASWKTTRARWVIGLTGILVFFIGLILMEPEIGHHDEEINNKSLRSRGVDNEISYFTEPVTNAYWSARFSASRGWVLVEVGGTLVRHPSLFGYSPDGETAKQRLASEASNLYRLLEYGPLEDVYWIAILLYYGLWGLCVWLGLMIWLYRLGGRLSKRASEPTDVIVGHALQVIVALAVVSAMVYRTFEIRGFSFYLWLMVGFAISRARRLDSHLKSSPRAGHRQSPQ